MCSALIAEFPRKHNQNRSSLACVLSLSLAGSWQIDNNEGIVDMHSPRHVQVQVSSMTGLRFVPADPTMAIVLYPMNLARACST